MNATRGIGGAGDLSMLLNKENIFGLVAENNTGTKYPVIFAASFMGPNVNDLRQGDAVSIVGKIRPNYVFDPMCRRIVEESCLKGTRKVVVQKKVIRQKVI